MDVKREWRKVPPREPLVTLGAMVRDFQWRFPRERRDMVVEWCRKAPTLKAAINRAVYSKDEMGKHHNHQSKINKRAYAPMAMSLHLHMKEAERADTFDSLHDWVDEHKVEGWGPVGVYDIATRVGAYKGIEPTSVYLHAGVRQGWYALCEAYDEAFWSGPRAWASVQRIPHDALLIALQVLTADECEDFLCTYRSVFSECLKEKKEQPWR